ncbi:hypothetical protein QBC37DRAFT_376652 [Rhypophila decipiens]|uniref:Uncharacterized protein n=1 Tax=Rhypophila decipiens TaxID=261697 RepID=A0AAN7B7C4_9PEZI|nr:hypothetical protein QBC37DRAFT_376652 [Rhypophila decipiens]
MDIDDYVDICSRAQDGYDSGLWAFAAHACLHDVTPEDSDSLANRGSQVNIGSEGGNTYTHWLHGAVDVSIHFTGATGCGKSLLAYDSLRFHEQQGHRILAYLVPESRPGQQFTSRHILAENLRLLRSHSQQPFHLSVFSSLSWVPDTDIFPCERIRLDDHHELYKSQMDRFANLKSAFLHDQESNGPWNKFIKDTDLKTWMINRSDNMCDLGTKLDYLRHIVLENKNCTSDEMKLLVARTSLPTDDAFRLVVRDIPARGPMNLSALIWILNSVRPLAMAELAVFCALDYAGAKSILKLDLIRASISKHPTADFSKFQLSRLCHIHDGRIYLHQNRGLAALLDKKYSHLVKLYSWSEPESPVTRMFTRCIAYLKAIFESGIDRNMGHVYPDEQVHELAFLEYAVLYWPIHCRASADLRTTIDFLYNQNHFERWLRLYSIYVEYRDPPSASAEILTGSTPIQVAAYFGLDHVFHHLGEIVDQFTESEK